ncbi:GTPase [Klebsiella michiganensis]|nr:GTPase [Klebsiella michiganensis]
MIAKKRNHPHADAIHVAGWVSLFTLHVIWPFLWIWATLYRPERGWGMQHRRDETPSEAVEEGDEISELRQRVIALEQQINGLRPSAQPPSVEK